MVLSSLWFILLHTWFLGFSYYRRLLLGFSWFCFYQEIWNINIIGLKTGALNGKFEKKTLKQQQSMNKAFWSHFKHFGRLLGKFICSSLPARLMEDQEFPASKVHHNLQRDLLASFPANESPDITGQFGCGHRAKFSPSARGREGEFLTNSTYQLFETPKNQIPSDTNVEENGFFMCAKFLFSSNPCRSYS